MLYSSGRSYTAKLPSKFIVRGLTPEVLHVLIQSTSDVSLSSLRQHAAGLPTDWCAEVDDSQLFFKAMEVPSWVSVVAEAPWWAQFLAASASVYVSGIIAEAGKDTWKNRGKIASALTNAPSAIKTFVHFLISAREAGDTRTFVTLGIPFPDEYNTAHLKLDYSTQEELEFLVALFVHHLPTLEELWRKEGLLDKRPVGGMALQFGNDCSMLVSWLDRESLTTHERVLPFGQDL